MWVAVALWGNRGLKREPCTAAQNNCSKPCAGQATAAGTTESADIWLIVPITGGRKPPQQSKKMTHSKKTATKSYSVEVESTIIVRVSYDIEAISTEEAERKARSMFEDDMDISLENAVDICFDIEHFNADASLIEE